MARKDDILKKALMMFNSSNIKAVTTNHLANEINISPGNLYYYFKNKEEIIRNLFEEFMNKHMDLCYKYRSVERLEILLDFYDEYFTLVWDYRFIIRECHYLCSIDDKLKKMFEKYRETEISEIYKSSYSFIERGISPSDTPENVRKNAEVLSIVLSNLITYKFHEDFDQWMKTCQRCKELIFHIFSRRDYMGAPPKFVVDHKDSPPLSSLT